MTDSENQTDTPKKRTKLFTIFLILLAVMLVTSLGRFSETWAIVRQAASGRSQEAVAALIGQFLAIPIVAVLGVAAWRYFRRPKVTDDHDAHRT